MSKVKRIWAILENLAFFIFCMVVVLFLMLLLYFIQDTFGFYGTGVEGWRPDIS